MSFLAYGSTDQSAALESENQVSTSSSTGENLALAINTSANHNSPASESEVLTYALKPDGNAKTKSLGEACMYSCIMLSSY